MDKLVETISGLKLQIKVLILGGILLLIGAVFFSMFYMPAQTKIKELEPKLERLRHERIKKERIARQFDKYQREMEEIKMKLDAALRALPTKEEMPSLLHSISAAGNEIGLEFHLFQPLPEIKKNFYAEIPVNIQVEGTYHEVALFFDRVASLDRIVNIESVRIENPKEKGGKVLVKASCVAKTFRYFTEEEIKRIQKKKAKK